MRHDPQDSQAGHGQVRCRAGRESAGCSGRREHNYDAVADLVAERVGKSEGRMSAKRMLPMARAADTPVRTATSVAWSPRRKRCGAGNITAAAVRRCGHRGSIWSSTGPRPHRDCSCLRGAGILPLAVRWRSPLISGHPPLALIAEAFGAIRGVPVRCWPTGWLPQGRGGGQRRGPAPGLCPVWPPSTGSPRTSATRIGDPQSKGIVEHLCGYAQRDLAVLLATEAAIAGRTVDLRTANAAAREWCAQVNATVHSEIWRYLMSGSGPTSNASCCGELPSPAVCRSEPRR